MPKNGYDLKIPIFLHNSSNCSMNRPRYSFKMAGQAWRALLMGPLGPHRAHGGAPAGRMGPLGPHMGPRCAAGMPKAVDNRYQSRHPPCHRRPTMSQTSDSVTNIGYIDIVLCHIHPMPIQASNCVTSICRCHRHPKCQGKATEMSRSCLPAWPLGGH